MQYSFTEAENLFKQYNSEPFLVRHAVIVSGVMRFFAERHDPENEEFWAIVGLLHDVDYERFPERHCIAGAELLDKHGVDINIIRSAMSHGYGTYPTPYAPEHVMEKILFATDELTGLIGAAALMRPSKSVSDLETPSVKKKFKDKKFAAKCSREVILQGAEMLGWPLDELIEKTIEAMRWLESNLSGIWG